MRAIDADAFVRKIRKQYCEDCVRRKGIKNGKMQYLYEIGGVPCRACEIEDMLNEVEDAPPIHPEPHWIPVTERLPKKSGSYQVTTTNGQVATYIFISESMSSRKYWKRCATAWMPLPEPYKGVTDGRD